MITPIRCAGCGRVFQPRRSDALTCSVRCRVAAWRRSRRDVAASVQPDKPPAAIPIGVGPRDEPEDLHGWRRIPGGYVVPPANPRFTVNVNDNQLRRR